MTIYDIAFYNIKRKFFKKLLLMTALILCSSTVTTLFIFTDSQKNKIKAEFDSFGANIIVTPKTESFTINYGGISFNPATFNVSKLNLKSLDNIKTIPNYKNIIAVSPKIIEFGIIKFKNLETKALFQGINFLEEKKIKKWWELRGTYPIAENEIIIGNDLSSVFKLDINSIVELNGKKLIITGVLYPTGSQDDSIIFGDFYHLGMLFNKLNNISLIEIAAHCGNCPIEDIINELSVIMPDVIIKSVKQVMKQKSLMLNQFLKFSISITAIMIIISAILIFTTMMNAVSERTKEIGLFRAIGYNKKHIINIILTESIALSFLSGISGVVIGIVLSYTILPIFSEIKISLIQINALILIFTPIILTILAVISTSYPAYKAALIDPVITLNSL